MFFEASGYAQDVLNQPFLPDEAKLEGLPEE